MPKPKNTKASKALGDYEVGYGKPPKKHQFKDGHKGHNPGRKKAAPDVRKKLRDYALSMGFAKVNEERVRMLQLDMVVAAVFTKAKRGDLNAAKLIFLAVQASEEERSDVTTELTPIQLALLKELIPTMSAKKKKKKKPPGGNSD